MPLQSFHRGRTLDTGQTIKHVFVSPRKGIELYPAAFARCASVTDRQTDHATVTSVAVGEIAVGDVV